MKVGMPTGSPRWRAAMSEFSDRELQVGTAVLDRLHDLFDELLDR